MYAETAQGVNEVMEKAINKAKWVSAPKEFASPVISRTVTVSKVKKATIAISALGFFILYVNGNRVGDEYFLPSASLYRMRKSENFTYPIYDEFTYRCYYSVFDITGYLKDGDNKIEVALGDGKYRQTERTAEGNVSFGDRLAAIYAVKINDEKGENIFFSDGSENCRSSEITYCNLFYGEVYDTRIKKFETAKTEIISLPETSLSPEISPPDRIIRNITPTLVCEKADSKIYDAGENISGFVSLKINAAKNGCVRIRFSETMEKNELNFDSTGACDYKSPSGKPQIMEDVFYSDGNEHIYHPRFVWHAFRYFEIIGCAEPISVHVVHSDVKKTADFKSSSPELNMFFDTFLRTQTNNMHAGIPLDCPHRERLGYTGDGQVCAPAAMLMLDTKSFYRKWICDIFDSQDKISGHVNHTAPFEGGGGGPGGWGMAAITVPYNFYKIYGDISPARENFENIKKWINYLEKHSENGLVIREEDGGWCLGDWCTLEKTVIDEPFVNTCLFIRALKFAEEIAVALKFEADSENFVRLRKAASKAVTEKYFDIESGSFLSGIQGADAFALAAGLGDKRTLANLKEKYKKLGHFDTGFLATDLLCEILFEEGAENTAVDLITSRDPGGFGYMFANGATTIWESWNDEGSHNHPMFGASARMLLSDVLGISQEENSYGFEKIVISPKTPNKLHFSEGHVTTPYGAIYVKWAVENENVTFKITLPENTKAKFCYGNERRMLSGGINIFTIKKFEN